MSLSEPERKKFESDLKKAEEQGNAQVAEAFRTFLKEFERTLDRHLADDDGREIRSITEDKFVALMPRRIHDKFEALDIRSPEKKANCKKVIKESGGRWKRSSTTATQVELDEARRPSCRAACCKWSKFMWLPRRQISVGDKMAGRHGNKG